MIAGDRFGKLTFIRDTRDRTPDGHTIGLFACECGREKETAISRVKSGRYRSCGICTKHRPVRHGMWRSPEHRSWQAMMTRCLNPAAKDYARYGAVGVTVCERWLMFANFYADMGPRPPGTTLDRFPNNRGNYEPGNCRWATPKQQAANRRER